VGVAVKFGSLGMALAAAPLLLAVIAVVLVALLATASTAKRQVVLLAVMDRLIVLATILRVGAPPSNPGAGAGQGKVASRLRAVAGWCETDPAQSVMCERAPLRGKSRER